MAEYNIDDNPLFSQSLSHLKYESRRRRFEERLAQSKCQREERDRVRKIRSQWEREDHWTSDNNNNPTVKNVDNSDDEESDVSPDLMESPPPPSSSKRKYKSANNRQNDRRLRDDSDSSYERNRPNTVKKSSYPTIKKDKSTTKKSNRRSNLRDNSDSDSIGQTRKEDTTAPNNFHLKSDKYSPPKRPIERDVINNKNNNNSFSSTKTAIASKSRKKPWQTDSSDESEVNFESIRRQRQETQQKLAMQMQQQQQQQKKQQSLNTTVNDNSSTTRPSSTNDNSKTNNLPSSKTVVKFSPKLPTTTTTTKKKNKLAYYSSSSSEDEAFIEERLRKRFQEKQQQKQTTTTTINTSNSKKERYSSNSGEIIPNKFQNKEEAIQTKINRYSSSSGDTPKRFQDENPLAPSKLPSKRTRYTQAESSSSEDEAELEQRFRKSMEEKRLAGYKRNPLSMAKKDEDDWRVRMENRLIPEERRLVGKDIILESLGGVEVKENVSDLGVSQEQSGSRRRRRGKVPLMESPLVSAKRQVNHDTEDDLWDDSENEQLMKGEESDNCVKSKKKGTKTPKAKDDDDWKPKKRGPRPKKTVDDSISPQLPRKRPSPTNKSDDIPIARKRNGRAKGRRSEPDKEESDSSIISDEEESRLSNQLKPNFANPALGPPGPLEPFVLFKGDGDTKPTAEELESGVVKHQVPASINRYLQDYQREGIQFMYSSVSEGKGCVLGRTFNCVGIFCLFLFIEFI